MKNVTLSILSLFLIFSGSIFAEEANYDPMERNLIIAEGEALITVPVNAFDISFDFDMERGTFSKAGVDSDRLIRALEANLKGLNIKQLEIIKSWDVMKQALISFKTKGRKVSNVFTVRVKNFEEGRLHELIAAIIDQSLAADPGLVLKRLRVYLTEDVENTRRAEAMTKAVQALESNAKRVADGLGRKVTAPKRVFTSTNDQPQPIRAQQYDMLYSEVTAPMKRSLVSVRKSFNVEADVVDHIDISANVSGIYQIE